MTPRWRLGLVYGLTAISGLVLGYAFAPSGDSITQIYITRMPQTPPDLVFRETLFPDDQPGLVSSSNLAMITESKENDRSDLTVRYWCPRSSDTWGELIYEWKWDETWQPQLAILRPNLHILTEFDPAARGEFYVASAVTNDRWIRLLEMGLGHSDTRLDYPIDVTKWVQTSRYFRIKFRLKAKKMMYHPTPNDPIGFAGAQALRQHYDKPTTNMRLMLWEHRPEPSTR